jgi:decaprenyl-phosphate phosphoribosyltransferase
MGNIENPMRHLLDVGRHQRVMVYLQIARPDHWIKNIFMIPGVAAALAVVPPAAITGTPAGNLILGLLSLCAIASANYTINEFLDAQYDRFHPLKNDRPGARGLLDGRFVLLQYVALSGGGILLARFINIPFEMTSVALLIMGLVYNVPPIRTKDHIYLDVLSESINNPLRFLLGWFSVTGAGLPPSSVILAYWMGGAFLMGVKRYSEFRGIGDPVRAGLYRRSFKKYTEQTLLLSAFFYAICSSFFIAIFLIKYRIEYVLTFPLFATLFTWYLAIGLKDDSAAQAPEKLYRETRFMAFAALAFIVAAALFFIDLPFLQIFMEPRLIRLP